MWTEKTKSSNHPVLKSKHITVTQLLSLVIEPELLSPITLIKNSQDIMLSHSSKECFSSHSKNQKAYNKHRRKLLITGTRNFRMWTGEGMKGEKESKHHLCAPLTPGTWEGRRAWPLGTEEGSPHYTGIFSGHSYRTWPMNSWLYNPGQWASDV